jgi:hypothetical protein
VSIPLYRVLGAVVGMAVSSLLLPAALAQTAPDAPESTLRAGDPASAAAARGQVPETGNPASSTLVRVTSSFEVNHAGAVLKQVARLFSAGFVRKDAEQVARMIDALAAEQSRTWEFSGLRKGVTYPLRVRARIDEFGMLDLDFFTVPAMAAPVRGAVDGYLNARGL